MEAYARRHTQEDAGALAWLVLGYAHILDNDYAKAVDPLSRAKPRAGDLGDYVNFYLGTAYFQSGRTPEAVATLADFEKEYPESLLLLARRRFGAGGSSNRSPIERPAVANTAVSSQPEKHSTRVRDLMGSYRTPSEGLRSPPPPPCPGTGQ